ncbi:MAG: succinate dehydrogenase [Hyphomicrobiaceae bacterium]
MNVRLYILQRATAMLMVPLIIIHVAVIFYATRRGLSAAEILGRTRGSIAWALYYGTFVLAAAIHAGIGVRTVAIEWGGLRPAAADAIMWGTSIALAVLGTRAVIAVVAP